MTATTQQLKRIQDKLQQLLKLCTTLQKENKQLKEELIEINKKASYDQQTIDHLKQQVDVLKLNTVEMNEADKKDFEKRINSYIKEIDRCIALLGK